MELARGKTFGRVVALLVTGLMFEVSGSSAGAAPGEVTAAREYFTDLKLLTQEGNEVRFFSDILEDRIVLISGFYTNCTTTSPRQNMLLSRLQKLLGERLGKEVFMVSITVDPERDTAEKVSEYAKVFRARPGWLFLTGKAENVDWVNYKLGQYLENIEDHKGVYLLGNLKTGMWMKAPPQSKLNDLYASLEKLLEDRGEDEP